MQTRRQSLIGSCTNVASGYFLALATQIVVFGAMGIEVQFSQNIAIGAIFTIVSLVRSYALRRAFNAWHR